MTVHLSDLIATRPRIREWTDVTPELFRAEILPRQEPAVLRGLVADWPLVRAGAESPAALVDYLAGFATAAPVPATTGPPSIKGRIFYSPDMRGLNVHSAPQKLVNVLRGLLKQMDAPEPILVAMQSVPVAEHLAGLEEANPMPLLAPAVKPRAWIGNAATVAPHFDLYENLACVAAGRRRFILFPPEQVANLYVGPVDFTPAGTPVSMVDLAEPDLERFPKFEVAAAAALVAELVPGDVIFVPYLWWHAVQSLDGFNMLVNYWWSESQAPEDHPITALIHTALALRGLSPHQRSLWRAVFDHYVFTGDDPLGHVPPESRGALGALDDERVAMVRRKVVGDLQRLLPRGGSGGEGSS